MRQATPEQRGRAFLTVQRQWYAKLAETGFVDVEYGREDVPLKVACRENRGLSVLEYESRHEYYSRAGRYLHARKWRSWTDREAWRLHSEGFGDREVARSLARSRRWATATVARLVADCAAWRLDTRVTDDVSAHPWEQLPLF